MKKFFGFITLQGIAWVEAASRKEALQQLLIHKKVKLNYGHYQCKS